VKSPQQKHQEGPSQKQAVEKENPEGPKEAIIQMKRLPKIKNQVETGWKK